MSYVSTIPKKNVKFYQDVLDRLDSLIAPLLNGAEPEDEFLYKLDSRYSTSDGPAMIAVAHIGDKCALYAPEYLSENQLVIFEYLLRDVDSNDHLVVFSQRDYDVVQKYLYGKEVDVKKLFWRQRE